MGTIAARVPEVALAAPGSETSSFEATYARFGRKLYATAMRFVRRTDEAEDAVQDAFLAYYTARPEMPESEVGPWLHRVLVNGCIDRLRRRDRWRVAELYDDTVVQGAGSPALGLDLEHAVARLPEKARVIFLLHDVEGFKHRELGEMLQVSVGTTKSQLFRARRMLRDFMQGGSS